MCFNTKVDAPAPRDLAKETGDTLQTQINLAPQQLEAYKQTAPGYAQTDINTLGQGLFGEGFSGNLTDINRRLTGEANAQSIASNTSQRTADLADVNAMGGQVDAARRAANPELFNTFNQVDAAAQRGMTPSAYEQQAAGIASQPAGSLSLGRVSGPQFDPRGSLATGPGQIPQVSGPGQIGAFDPSGALANTNFSAQNVSFSGVGPGIYSQQVKAGRGVQLGADPLLGQLNQQAASAGVGPLQTELEKQAASDLALGSNLSDQEQRLATAQSRAAYSSRGMGDSNSALAGEVLNLDSARRARQDARRGFAAATDAQGFGQRNALFGQSLGVVGANQARQGQSLQAQQFNSGQRLNAQQFNSGQSLQAQQANQAARLQASGQSLQAQQANQAAGLQAAGMGLDAQRANQSFLLGSYGQNAQTQLANSAQGLQAQQANQAAALQASGQSLDAQRANQNYLLGAFGQNSSNYLNSAQANNSAAAQEAAYRQAANAQQFGQLGQLAGMDAQRQQQNFNQLQTAAGNRLATFNDPFQGVLGRSSGNVGTNAQLFGQNQSAVQPGMAQSRAAFDPFNPYAQDLYNTNYNGQAAANIASANAKASMWGAALGAAGSIGGGFLAGGG